MRIYIPSRGRYGKQKTLERLAPAIAANVILVVTEAERDDYKRLGHKVAICPHDGIVQTRDFILEHAEKYDDKVVMLDDDLILQRRREDGRITDCTEEEMVQALAWIEDALSEVAHASFGTRFLGYDSTDEYIGPGRMMYVLGYNIPAVRAARASFGKGLEQFSTMEDFNMTLQLLTQGFINRISMEWRCAPGQSNAPGGCSEWRTTERQTESAHRLAALFPGLVTVRAKKNWDRMAENMFDVTVSWKRAFAPFMETP